MLVQLATVININILAEVAQQNSNQDLSAGCPINCICSGINNQPPPILPGQSVDFTYYDALCTIIKPAAARLLGSNTNMQMIGKRINPIGVSKSSILFHCYPYLLKKLSVWLLRGGSVVYSR